MTLRADVTAALVAGVYLFHRIGRRSGATTEEARSALPGDELVRHGQLKEAERHD
jgi:hypothetical protein